MRKNSTVYTFLHKESHDLTLNTFESVNRGKKANFHTTTTFSINLNIVDGCTHIVYIFYVFYTN